MDHNLRCHQPLSFFFFPFRRPENAEEKSEILPDMWKWTFLSLGGKKNKSGSLNVKGHNMKQRSLISVKQVAISYLELCECQYH